MLAQERTHPLGQRAGVRP